MGEKVNENKKVKIKFKLDEIEANEAYSEIEKLNDDVLILIFENLRTIADKIRIERVCKKWQYLAKKSWSSTKYLDLRKDTWGITKEGCVELDKDIVAKVGRLCGKYLTSVSLNMPAFLEICKLNLRIQELHLYDFKEHICQRSSKCILFHECTIFESSGNGFTNNQTLRYLLLNNWEEILKSIIPNITQNIQKFYLELGHQSYEESDLNNLFAAMRKVKTVSLKCDLMNYLKGTYLEHLSFNTIEEITLSGLGSISNDLISSVIKKCQNLRKIVLNGLQSLKQDLIFIAASTHADTLKHLSLQRNLNEEDLEEIDHMNILLSMSKLRHLEYLSIRRFHTALCNEFVKVVSKNCLELTHLGLINYAKVTGGEGFSAISSLRKLRVLDLSCSLTITRNFSLENLHFLEVLNLNCRFDLEDRGLCTFLKNAFCLRILDVVGCSNISHEVIGAVLRLVQVRPSYITLQVMDNSSGIFARNTRILPPLIKVIIYDHVIEAYDVPNALETHPQVHYYPLLPYFTSKRSLVSKKSSGLLFCTS